MWRSSNLDHQAGFTLIETLIVAGIVAVLIGMAAIASISYIPQSVSTASQATLLSDLRQQQLKAMLGVEGSSHGIYFGTGEYVMFTGSVYNSGDPTNVVIPLEDQLSFSTTLPSNQIVFAEVSGMPTNLPPTQDQVQLSNALSGAVTTFEINSIGVPVRLPE